MQIGVDTVALRAMPSLCHLLNVQNGHKRRMTLSISVKQPSNNVRVIPKRLQTLAVRTWRMHYPLTLQ
jgi:hypothetical protein